MKQFPSNWPRRQRGLSRLLSLLLCAVLVLAAAALIFLINATEPDAERAGATRETAMLVQISTPESGSFRPVVELLGTVMPARDIMLRPRVSGQIEEIAPSFRPGGKVARGDWLVRLDRDDLENALEQRRSALAEAQAALALEQGQQEFARQDYQQLGDNLSEERRALVLRQPQLQTAEAQLRAAQAAVRQAELDLERAEIRAPFDAQILSREVNVGSQIDPATNLAHLVGTEAYWIEATVPLAQLPWLQFPAGDEAGAPVRVRNERAWPDGAYRQGRLDSLVGALDEDSRMARFLIRVEDPLGIDGDAPPLLVGSFVSNAVTGKPLDDVVRIPRELLRRNDTVWVMSEEDTLDIRDVEVAFRDAQHAYIRSGLDAGARVVTTQLASVVQGAALRVEGETAAETP